MNLSTIDCELPGSVLLLGRRLSLLTSTFLSVAIGAMILVVLQTTIRIELQNNHAGGYLPRNDLTAIGNQKWRARYYDNQARWLEMLGPKDVYGNPVNRPLTCEEIVKMQSDIDSAKNLNLLRELVANWGMVQYPATFFLLICSVFRIKFSTKPMNRVLGALGILVAMVCGSFMFHRGYFTSLGF